MIYNKVKDQGSKIMINLNKKVNGVKTKVLSQELREVEVEGEDTLLSTKQFLQVEMNNHTNEVGLEGDNKKKEWKERVHNKIKGGLLIQEEAIEEEAINKCR